MKTINKGSLLLFFIIILLYPILIFGQNSGSGEKGMRTIYLIRHGQYDHDNEKDEYTGRELVPLGIAQTKLLAERLKSMPVEFNSLISSKMMRARQTAIIINQYFPELEHIENGLINECTPPTWREDIMAATDPAEVTECVENLEKAFDELFIPSPDSEGRHDIFVCHGNVIRYFVTKVLNVDTKAWLKMSIANCSLTIIRIMPDGRMGLDTFSDYGHVPESMRTFTGGDDKRKELVVPTVK